MRHNREPEDTTETREAPIDSSLVTTVAELAEGTPANSAQPDPSNRKKQQDHAPEDKEQGN